MPRSASQSPDDALQGNLFGAPASEPEAASHDLSDDELGADAAARAANRPVTICVEINQCRVDGVEVDAAIQDERAVNLISTQVTMGRRLCESPSSARRCPGDQASPAQSHYR